MDDIGITIEAPVGSPLSRVFSRVVVGVVQRARDAWAHFMVDEPDILEASVPFVLERFRFQGVYFLLKDATVVYVGQTTNIVSRLLSHAKRFGLGAFDRVAFIPIDDQRLLSSVEEFYIAKFIPALNRTKPWSFQRLERELVRMLGQAGAAILLEKIIEKESYGC